VDAGWEVRGTYLESCNCDAVCPCRRIDGAAGGRSTHGVCLGVLTWRVEAGSCGQTPLAGRDVVFVTRYSDDEPGSPWTFAMFVDPGADDAQAAALADIYTGALGGTPLRQFPWAFKPSTFLGWRRAEIEIDHTPGHGNVRVKDAVDLEIREPVATPATVTCVIPGHHRTGRELYARLLRAELEEPLRFELEGVCAYESDFAYSSADGR
jgi:hypothetical protein